MSGVGVVELEANTSSAQRLANLQLVVADHEASQTFRKTVEQVDGDGQYPADVQQGHVDEWPGGRVARISNVGNCEDGFVIDLGKRQDARPDGLLPHRKENR